MKLLELISCDIYRDGGSLEATWKTDKEKDFAIFLEINSWERPLANKTYRLFNCNLKELPHHEQIAKGSSEHLELMKLVKEWTAEGRAGLNTAGEADVFSLGHLLHELEKGNY